MLYRPPQYSVRRFRRAVLAFRQNVSTAVFDDCSLMLVGLGESLEGVVGLFAVP